MLWLDGASGLVKSDPFEGLDGFLYAFQCITLCMAADSGTTGIKPPRPPQAKETAFDRLTFARSEIANGWLLQVEIKCLKFEGWVRDFAGLRIALVDMAAFYAYRAGRMSLQAANSMSSRPLAVNPGEMH